MSSVELRKNAQTTMQNGIEKIKGVIFKGVKQQTKTRKRRIHITSDDSIIDAEYEEIK